MLTFWSSSPRTHFVILSAKAHLKKLLEKTEIQFSENFEIDGKEMFAHACKIGLEGVVSKVRDSRYLSGRGRTASDPIPQPAPHAPKIGPSQWR
jgi:hypothetical protein